MGCSIQAALASEKLTRRQTSKNASRTPGGRAKPKRGPECRVSSAGKFGGLKACQRTGRFICRSQRLLIPPISGKTPQLPSSTWGLMLPRASAAAVRQTLVQHLHQHRRKAAEITGTRFGWRQCPFEPLPTGQRVAKATPNIQSTQRQAAPFDAY
jgi:hypothetical protein